MGGKELLTVDRENQIVQYEMSRRPRDSQDVAFHLLSQQTVIPVANRHLLVEPPGREVQEFDVLA